MTTDHRARSRGLFGTALLLGALLLVLAAPRGVGAQSRKFLVQGEEPPDFALLDTSGRVVQLSEFRGRTILLSFWSCYTDTCFASTAAYTDLIERLGPLGLAAPTVCQEIPPVLAADGYAGLLKRCSAGQTILVDQDQRVGTEYFVREFPTTFLIGPDFAIREIVTGVAPLRDPAFHDRLEGLVRMSPGIGQPQP